MRSNLRPSWRSSIATVIASVACAAAPTAVANSPLDFSRDVHPILEQHCLRCHGGIKQAGGLSLVERAGAMAEGGSGQPAVLPGDPQRSELYRRIVSEDEDERMPVGGPPLSSEEIRVLRQWIAEGASWPTHWSLQPIRRPTPPAVRDAAWPRNAIDHFVLARLEAAGIAPAPEADADTLVRRLYLDLLGLPPTPLELDALSEDLTDEDYERLVDSLLASPHFGERWGRHWLDLARYADTDGYEVDGPRPNAWYWRDWVIEAINSDLPLDRFTIEQLAGDLLPAASPDQHLATAFHRQTLTNKEGGVDAEEYRVEAVIDRVSTTATVWLGLTLGCAQCHDHPSDPFTQREFFQLFAFFNNADEAQLQTSSADGEEIQLDVMAQRTVPRETWIFRRGDFRQPVRSHPVTSGGFAALPPLMPRAPGALPDRLDLARWIVAPENPLPARVAANRFWMRLFGAGLVRTPDDFGASGEPPTHPELSDWLAHELLSGGWSRKRLIREIVTSATYRQSSVHRADIAAVDPDNRLWHRQNRLRVEGEIVHDLHLAAADLLTRKIGGPSVYPPFPQELTKIDFRSDQVWPTSTGEDRYRRGMYTFFKRTLPHPNLTTFDCPQAEATLVQRNVSNTPLQALATLNNEVFLDAARAAARRILPLGDDEAPVRAAARICLARWPTPQEQSSLLRLADRNRAWFADRRSDAIQFAGERWPEGTDPVEAAALTATVSVLLNLDEFITRE